jgi:hypothetical protein
MIRMSVLLILVALIPVVKIYFVIVMIIPNVLMMTVTPKLDVPMRK